MLQKRCCWFALALFFLIACSGLGVDSESTTVPIPETTVPVETPVPTFTPTTAIPTSTAFQIPTATATSDTLDILLPTATLLPVELQPPFPDNFLNLAVTQNPLFTCVDPAKLGQIWLTNYPYETAEQYVAGEQIGYYEPTLSPNGEWLAMVAVNIENPTGVTQSNGAWQFYKDGIWLMRSDRSAEPQQVSDDFVRAEFRSTEANSCTVTAGVERIIGWSPNGKWLAFITSSPEEDFYSPDLFILNMETFKQTVVASNVNTAVWMEDYDSALLFHSFSPAIITKASLNGININFEEFNLPQQISAQYQIWNTQYDPQSQSILIRGKERNASFNAPFSFWQLDILTDTWQMVSKLNSSSIHYVPHSNWALRCLVDGQNIPILERTTWEIMGNIEGVEGWRCDFSFLRDSKNNQAVSLTSAIDREKIWVSLVSSAGYGLEQVIDTDNFEIPEGYEIVDYAWKQ